MASAAWVRSAGSFSRRRHATAGGDAGRRSVTSERERDAIERERARSGGWSGPLLPRLGSPPPPFPSLFPFLFFVVVWV